MKYIKSNERGFTLIEMMIVLLVISVLLIITVPNIGKHNEAINDKGCQALVKMAEAQVNSYKLEKGTMPSSITELVTAGYLKESQTSCPNGNDIVIASDGTVSPKEDEDTSVE